MLSAVDAKTEVEVDGFAISDSILSIQTVNHLLIALERISEVGSIRKRGGIFAVRTCWMSPRRCGSSQLHR